MALNLIVSITPSSLWGEALHVSGLFAYLMKILLDGEVYAFFKSVNHILNSFCSDRHLYLG